MKSISKGGTVFDGFVEDAKDAAPKLVAKSLERIDVALYSAIDHSRFRCVKVKARTVMTSLGPVTYSRRCYYDSFGEAYVWPADIFAGIAPRAKVSDELKRKAVENAAEMTYSMAGRHSCLSGCVSKSTVCRAVRDARVIPEGAPATFGKCVRVHVQIDEKFMGFLGSRRKRPRYTATVFSGREPIEKGHKMRLLRRTIVSAETPAKLARKINAALSGPYGLGLSDRAYVSGDLASYIRLFGERIDVCETAYVPDKWHVLKALSDAYPEFAPIAPSDVPGILDVAIALGDFSRLEAANALDLLRLYRKDPGCFARWGEEGYEGCSQEGMNAHYYAPRFAKLANRFRKSTIEKLCQIIEAKRNGTRFRIGVLATQPPDPKQMPWLGKPYEERAKFAIDTSQMGERLRMAIDAVRYGGLS